MLSARTCNIQNVHTLSTRTFNIQLVRKRDVIRRVREENGWWGAREEAIQSPGTLNK